MCQSSQRAASLSLRAYRFVNRPYYWYRPSQLAHRRRLTGAGDGTPLLVRAAWGSQLYCWPDQLGRAVARTGVYDLTVIETLARLVEPGETAIDAGANVGLMSNLLGHAVGPDGRVVSFEPHPLIFATLARNVERWAAVDRIHVIEARQAAISSSAGTLPLAVDPETFAHNKGTASLELAGSAHSTEVETVALDADFSAAIGVLKLDVEMHELAALQGARSLLERGLIRDIVFEEHAPPPTPATSLLEAHGYTVMGIRQGLTGPILSSQRDAHSKKLWDAPALLATRDPERARRRLERRGWVSLRGRFNGRSG